MLVNLLLICLLIILSPFVLHTLFYLLVVGFSLLIYGLALVTVPFIMLIDYWKGN